MTPITASAAAPLMSTLCGDACLCDFDPPEIECNAILIGFCVDDDGNLSVGDDDDDDDDDDLDEDCGVYELHFSATDLCGGSRPRHLWAQARRGTSVSIQRKLPAYFSPIPTAGLPRTGYRRCLPPSMKRPWSAVA